MLSVVSFTLIHSLPGDPLEAMIGGSARDVDPQELAEIRAEFGLDQPLVTQYLIWLKGWTGQGELGRSYQDNRKVLEVIWERIPATLTLIGMALVISFAVGLAWGLFMVWIRFKFRSTTLESPFVVTALVFYSIPAFFVGLLAIYAVTVVPGFRAIPLFGPIGFDENLGPTSLFKFAILPALVLSLGRSAKVALFVRSLATDEISKPYVMLALAKGLAYHQVILRHVVRNCLIPVINLLALSLPALIGGSVLIETIFAWPGMGRLAVDATFGRNYPVMTTLVMFYGAMVVLSNLLADIGQSFVDPRFKDEHMDGLGQRGAVRAGQKL